jgi:AraC-like DNA-binding protein
LLIAAIRDGDPVIFLEQNVDPRFIDKNLSHISYNWGFINFSHFTRVFRSGYGLSSRGYHKQGSLQGVS